jgi:hypothetical protein
MNLLNAAISIASAGDNAVIAAAGATTCIRVHRLTLSNGAATAQAVIVKDGATALTGAMALPTSVGGLIELIEGSDAPLFILSQNSALNLNLANATSVTGFVQYSLG